jgi:hypothetical protein
MGKLEDWVTVVPPKGGVATVARALLELADSPADVRTANAGNEFLVPPSLADLYHALSQPAPKRSPRKRKTEESD